MIIYVGLIIEKLLFSICYNNLFRKFLFSFFNYEVMIPLIFINGFILFYLIFTKPLTLDNMSGIFALSVGIIVIIFLYFLSIVFYYFSVKFTSKKYYKLDIYIDFIIVNDLIKYQMDKIEIRVIDSAFYMHGSCYFQIIEKATNKLIVHFNFNHKGSFFLINSPDLIKTIIKNGHLLDIENIEKIIRKDRIKVKKFSKKINNIFKITLFLLLMLFVFPLIVIKLGQDFAVPI